MPKRDLGTGAKPGTLAESGACRVIAPLEYQRLIATEARRERRPIAGYDLVFTPVRSVSLLWALGGLEVRAEVEAAHREAVTATIGGVERHAAFTRTGHGGTAQVDTTGSVCAAFRPPRVPLR